ncbi:hypothetical protein [Sphingomonas aurantiaca]|uniref:hypothetical protein n=1 Tax=Sphingomonas aurantiaca TaxID=185949 RepID=UPI002FE11A0B
MSYIIDIGGAPANEDCAQLGQTPDFEAVNTFEVLAYKLAIIARHGMPPAGCKLGPHTNRHDFGVYRTLALHIEDEEDEAVQAYAEAVEEGLGSWLEAGFTPPVIYAGSVATIERLDHVEPGDRCAADDAAERRRDVPDRRLRHSLQPPRSGLSATGKGRESTSDRRVNRAQPLKD